MYSRESGSVSGPGPAHIYHKFSKFREHCFFFVFFFFFFFWGGEGGGGNVVLWRNCKTVDDDQNNWFKLLK